MKLQALHLILIFIGALLLCHILGDYTCEGMTSNLTKSHYIGPAGDTVDVYKNDSENNSNNLPNFHDFNLADDNSASKTITINVSEDSSRIQPTLSTSKDKNSYHSLQGIPREQIPDEDKDLYILKSEIVPPVCPACPTQTECPRQKPCPPCPPCARCPEPSFECKKVPNYTTSTTSFLPRPVLTDFSTFAM